MKTKILHLLLVVPLLLALSVAGVPAAASDNPEGETGYTDGRGMPAETWTFMVYMAADNNLDPAALDDLNEMEVAGSTADVSIIALLDRYGNDNTVLYEVAQDSPPTPAIVSSPLAGPFASEVNTGDPATLVTFVEWTVANYPADHYALVMWDHGSGWKALDTDETPFKGVCWDETSGYAHISTAELASALAQINTDTGVVLDIIGFDACLMQMAEIEYEIHDYASYMVASEEVEPFNGWPYDTVLSYLTANPYGDVAAVASNIVSRYMDYYTIYGTGIETLSAVDTGPAVSNLNAFADSMVAGGEWATIVTARINTEFFNDPDYIDLYHFAENVKLMSSNSTVQANAQAVMDSVAAGVTANGYGAVHPDVHGISIYFPISGTVSAAYADLAFAADTSWDEFLAWYLVPQEPSWTEIISDPAGDLITGTGFDITGVDTAVSNGSLFLRVRADTTIDYDNYLGSSLLDTDQDPETGAPVFSMLGGDYAVSAGAILSEGVGSGSMLPVLSPEVRARLENPAAVLQKWPGFPGTVSSWEFVALLPLYTDTSSYWVMVPLSLLGPDDGLIDTIQIARDIQLQAICDVAPDPPGGSISGTVYQSDGVTPVAGAVVSAFEYNSLYDEWIPAGSCLTATNGCYHILAVPTGIYGVRVATGAYVTEWYGGAYDHHGAVPVSVTEPLDTPDIDFILEPGGAISGFVSEDDGVTPIQGAQVEVLDFSSILGQWIHYGGTQTAADGSYTVSGLPPVLQAVKVRAEGFTHEWYNDVYNQNAATPVPVTVGVTTPDINFTLEPSAALFGTVYESDNITPIPYMHIQVYEAATENWVMSTDADGSGNYTVHGLPAGSYKIRTRANQNGLNYIDEWYYDRYSWGEADPVIINPPGDTGPVNFSLDEGGFITGIVRAADGVTPLAGVSVECGLAEGNVRYEYATTTNGSGHYTIAGLPYGLYLVRAPSGGHWGPGDDNLVVEYYDEKTSVMDAAVVEVSEGVNPTEVHFTLESGGSISGHVYETDGTTPIPNLQVFADDSTTGEWKSGAPTDGTGAYTLHGLPEGSYIVTACGSCNHQNYIAEFYFETNDYLSATPVSVTGTNDTPGIDFTLDSLLVRDTLEESIADGIAWLVSDQNPDGSWGEYWQVSKTGLALLKLITHARDIGLSPDNPAYQYVGNIEAGFDFLFENAYITDVTLQSGIHDPDTNGNGNGVYFRSPLYPPGKTHNYDIYESSIVLMALSADPVFSGITIVSPGSPVNGMTVSQVAQDVVDYLAWSQTDADYGRGGWNYEPMNNQGGRSDQSNSGWVTLGLAYAENCSSLIPGFIRTELDYWIDYIQDDVSGGSLYSEPSEGMGASMLRTGNLLQQMAFIGDTVNATRVQNALDFIVDNWNYYYDPGWRGNPSCYHATYTVMKGLEAFGIETLDGTIDWFQEFTGAIMSEQSLDGWWQVSCYDDGERILSSEWAMLTLQKTTAATLYKPDLVVTSISVHDRAPEGYPDTCRVELSVKNRGNGAVTDNQPFYISAQVNGTGVATAVQAVNLGPGESYDTSIDFTPCPTVRSEIQVCLDYHYAEPENSDLIDELNEDNNCRTALWPWKDWLVMVYMAADNEMDGMSWQEINEMEWAGSTDQVDILVLRDGIGEGDSGIYYIQHDEDWGNMVSPQVRYLGEVNTGDPETLVDFLFWAMQTYTAQKRALIFWDGVHDYSAAWREEEAEETRGVCTDQHSSNDYLTLPEIKSALAQLAEQGWPHHLIGFDTGLMASAEVASQIGYLLTGPLGPFGKAIVASQDLEILGGWNYQASFQALVADPLMDPHDLAAQIITDYNAFAQSRSYDWATLSAINTDNVSSLMASLEGLAQAMLSSDEPGVMDKIRTARDNAECFWFNLESVPYIDLYDFASGLIDLSDDAYIDTAAADVTNAVSTAIVAEEHGSLHEPGAHGISIYFPTCAETYNPDYATSGLYLTENTSWDEFLGWILEMDTIPPPVPDLIAPDDGNLVSPAPVLRWTYVSDESGVSYTLQVDDSADFSSPVFERSGLFVLSESMFYRLVPALSLGTYYWRVRAVDGAGTPGGWSDERTFVVGPTPKWSYTFQPILNRMTFGQSVAIADLDVNNKETEPDADLEIATGSDELGVFIPEIGDFVIGAWRVLDSEGDVEWVRNTMSDQANDSAAIADLDGDGDFEIIGGTTSGETVEVMDKDGNFVWTFPTPARSGNRMWHSSPAVADVNPDVSGLEVIIGNRPLQTIFCFDGDNSDGIDEGISASSINWPSIGGGTYGWEGNEGTDWDILWIYTTSGWIFSTPAVGDVDGDGQLEVVVGSGVEEGAHDGRVFILNGADGTLEHALLTGAGSIESSAALADFGGDGSLEIVVGAGDGKIYLFTDNGQGGGPTYTTFQTGGPVHSSPSIGDLDNDGALDVVVGSDDGNVYCLDYNPVSNTVVQKWQYATGGAVYSSAAIAGRHQKNWDTGNWDMLTSILVAGPGFSSIEDLLSGPGGANIAVRYPDQHPYYQAAVTALDSYGVSYNLINLPDIPDLYLALDDGTVDAALLFLPNPAPMIETYISELGCTVLPWSTASIEAVTAQFPRTVATVLPAYTYTGQEEGIPGYAVRHYLDVYIGSDDGNVYLLDGISGYPVLRYMAGTPVRSTPCVADVDGDNRLEVVFADWAPLGPQGSVYRDDGQAPVRDSSLYEGSRDVLWCYKDHTSSVPACIEEWPMFRNGADRTGSYAGEIPEQGPDLKVLFKREEWIDEGAGIYGIFYVIKNTGNVVVPAGHSTLVSFDTYEMARTVPVDLYPGGIYSDKFEVPVALSGGSDIITVTADFSGDIAEVNENNNTMVNTWPPPGVPVVINAPGEVAPDTGFVAKVDIGHVTDLNAVQYDLYFDPCILRLDDITPGSVGGTTMPVDANELSPGHWRVVQSLLVDAVTGSGWLAELHFHVEGMMEDYSTIELADGILSGMAGEIPASWIGDFVFVSGIPGDANGDGVVNVLDMTKVARIILELDPPTPGADANMDGFINVLDMTRIARIILELD